MKDSAETRFNSSKDHPMLFKSYKMVKKGIKIYFLRGTHLLCYRRVYGLGITGEGMNGMSNKAELECPLWFCFFATEEKTWLLINNLISAATKI